MGPKVVLLTAVAAGIAAAVGTAFIMLGALSALGGVLVEPNDTLREISLTVMAGAIFVASIVAGVTAFQYVRDLLNTQL